MHQPVSWELQKNICIATSSIQYFTRFYTHQLERATINYTKTSLTDIEYHCELLTTIQNIHNPLAEHHFSQLLKYLTWRWTGVSNCFLRKYSLYTEANDGTVTCQNQQRSILCKPLQFEHNQTLRFNKLQRIFILLAWWWKSHISPKKHFTKVMQTHEETWIKT